jgi:dCMP deaminase
MERLVVGLTGAFGSGCTFLSTNFFQERFKFHRYSLSDELKKQYEIEKGHPYENRSELQVFGNELRSKDAEALAKLVHEKILGDEAEANALALLEDSKDTKFYAVVDSIRNPAEIEFFRKHFPEFVLFAVFADYEVRWGRVKREYDESKDTFDKDERKDQGASEPSYGQKITSCFFQADVVISNNNYINHLSPNEQYFDMLSRLDNYIRAFTEPTKSKPTIDETLMATAYAVGRRSRCIRRRVGAVIVDRAKCVLSTGFNSVPAGLNDCKSKFGECYRIMKRNDMKGLVLSQLREECFKDSFISERENIASEITSHIKVLELCRSLHAEENAILGLVGRSFISDLSESTLYTTTYPCNLCANKIVQVGIRHVVYFEPYPVVEAKLIFDEAGVKTTPFEGVTFRAFFKAFDFEE